MSNEELAMQIKQGNKTAVDELWKATKPFIYKCCFRFYNSKTELCLSAGITVDDLIQEAYFALLKAVESYKPLKGYKLLTYMTYHLQTAFNELTGVRSSKKETLNYSTSLNTPLGNSDGELELLETIADDSTDIEDAEKRIYNTELHNDLDEAMSKLNPTNKEILESIYYKGYTVNDIAKSYNITEHKARYAKDESLRALRRDNRLREYKDDIISRYGYRSNFIIWKRSGYSSTERAAFKLLGEL